MPVDHMTKQEGDEARLVGAPSFFMSSVFLEPKQVTSS
eukprot:CAMPEP_0184510678 /NCGR_PEP_ID=MMETSP0198_2-20121128/1943_1 /TAXON_ID=1112570 /ORGANISM="Thraustochytrium sp., Strain LLF1b" /LENGTH=37 /DNA_ID= /DNA_START= /DNA_END= /DNA_ORIENTATION=